MDDTWGSWSGLLGIPDDVNGDRAKLAYGGWRAGSGWRGTHGRAGGSLVMSKGIPEKQADY